MKKNLTLISLVLGVMLLVSVSGIVSAGIDVTGVTLDGESSIAVEAGDTPLTEVTVHTWGSGSSDEWESTSYMIEGTGWTCVNTQDYYSDGTHSNSFTITIPALVADSYDFTVRAYQDESCNGNYDSFTLDDGIIVEDDSSCNQCTITINPPVEDHYYADSVPIQWTVDGECDATLFSLEYKLGDCNSQNSFNLIDSSWYGFSYDWASGLADAQVCIRVNAMNGCCGSATQEFYIDNTNPFAEANGETWYCDEEGTWWMPDCGTSQCGDDCNDCCTPRKEYGVYTCYEGDYVMLDGSGSYDIGTFQSGIASWIWSEISGEEFGEFNSGNSGEDDIRYNCIDGTNNVTIELNVTDGVGNSDVDTTIVQILNVAPECNSVTADETTVPLVDGQATVEFTVDATDVGVNDVLTYTWTFGDGTTETTTETTISHTYDSADTYSVSVTVFDGEEYASVPCEVTTVNVVIPTDLGVHEVAAFYPLVAEFNDGSANNKFMHGLADLSGETDECIMIDGPENLIVSDLGGENHCTIFWDRSHTANPTNAERGDNFVLFKVTTSEGDIQYYSFNVKVYSWMIDMNEEWNLISIPLTAEEGSKPGEVFDHAELANSIYEIWSYEYNSVTDENEWMCVRLTNSNEGSQCGSTTKLETIKPGRAYWVKLESGVESVTAKGMGLSPDELGMKVMSLTIDVPTNDWSLVGRYGIVSSGSGMSRVYGDLSEGIALDSLDKVDNDLHVYTEDFEITHSLSNNEGYWLWIEDNAFNNAGYESYAPIDEWFPRNSGLSL